MRYELSQRFHFDAAHSLQRDVERESSARIHGHTYHAEVTFCGMPDPASGMVVDLGAVRRALEKVKDALDHRFLDEVPTLGAPTLENLCAFIARQLQCGPAELVAVRVWRDSSGDSCTLRLS